MADTSTQLNYKLDAFEGPLDLLLLLISKNKIDIYDIKISLLLDQYLEQISKMEEQDMDIASEFLEMASRLVYIKSVMLLPKYEEEAQELKRELQGQLIEYQQCREAAAKLSTMYSFDTYCRLPSPVEYDLTYNRIHPSMDIAKAYTTAVGRGKRKLPPPKEAFSGIVERKIISVNSRIIRVMRRLWHKKNVSYSALFDACDGKSDLVATFLAVLELVKGKRVVIDGDGDTAVVRMLEEQKRK
ncbi:MAG: segregation/condensation protein A [Ruminococcus sp.]|nr:segregation/condensation protein A [Ruminococcus sp.]